MNPKIPLITFLVLLQVDAMSMGKVHVPRDLNDLVIKMMLMGEEWHRGDKYIDTDGSIIICSPSVTPKQRFHACKVGLNNLRHKTGITTFEEIEDVVVDPDPQRGSCIDVAIRLDNDLTKMLQIKTVPMFRCQVDLPNYYIAAGPENKRTLLLFKQQNDESILKKYLEDNPDVTSAFVSKPVAEIYDLTDEDLGIATNAGSSNGNGVHSEVGETRQASGSTRVTYDEDNEDNDESDDQQMGVNGALPNGDREQSRAHMQHQRATNGGSSNGNGVHTEVGETRQTRQRSGMEYYDMDYINIPDDDEDSDYNIGSP